MQESSVLMSFVHHRSLFAGANFFLDGLNWYNIVVNLQDRLGIATFLPNCFIRRIFFAFSAFSRACF